MFRHVLMSPTQPEIWSIHVVVRTRTAKKCTKMKNARAGLAELLFLLIIAIILWRSHSRYRSPCVISLFLMTVCAFRLNDPPYWFSCKCIRAVFN